MSSDAQKIVLELLANMNPDTTLHEQELSQDPCKELAVVEEQVEGVSKALSILTQRMHILKERVNAMYSPFIRLLPPEIVAEIFFFCVPQFQLSTDEDLPLMQNISLSMPLRLGAVCSSWRRIAWSAPNLWSTISFFLTSALKIPTQVTLLEEWLTRTGQLPLSIRMGSNEEISWTGVNCEGMMKAIGKYASRWRDLDIRLPSTFYRFLPTCDQASEYPFLHSVILRPPGGQGDRIHKINLPITPQLRYLSLSCLYLRSITFHLEFLTNLELESFYIDETLEMLRQTTRLEMFTAKKILGGDDRHPIPEESILLSSLQELCIINDKGTDLPSFFDKITSPKLKTLFYASDILQSAPVNDIIGLIKRSGCELDTFTLAKAPIVEEHLQLLLAAMPTLTTLTLTMPVISGMRHAPLTDVVLQSWDPDFACANKLSCFLPRLKTFSYHGAQGFTWPILLRVLESRCPPPLPKDPSQATSSNRLAATVSCIQEIDLSLALGATEEPISIEPPDPSVIESLELRGVKITGNISPRTESRAVADD